MDGEERQRLEAMFGDYAPAVGNYFRRRVHSVSDIEDLLSEVFLVASRRISDIPVDNELAWLYATSYNVLSNWRRRVRPILVDALIVADTGVASETDDDILDLISAWRELSEEDREILRLAAWEGLSGEDLGFALGVGKGTAASSLSRARKKLSDLATKGS